MAEELKEQPQENRQPDTRNSGMDSLMRMLAILFKCLRILIVLIFAYLLVSGIFRVDEQNEAMLFHFGKLQYKDIGAGGETAVLTSGRWYWAWPFPIDWVKIIPAQKSVTVSTDTVFQPWVNPNMQGQAPVNEFLRPGADGYLLTGDTNILHARWDVNYRVVNSAKYYLNFYDDTDSADKDAEERGTTAIIRNLLANAALMEAGSWNVEDLLRTTRTLEDGTVENIKDKVQARLSNMLEDVGLGVEVQSVNLVDIQPPSAVQMAFRKVNEASETGHAETLKARSYAESVELAAEGQAYRILDEARSYRTRIVESTKADAHYFQTVLAQYEKNPDTMLTTLYMDAIREMLTNVPNKFVIHRDGESRQELRMRIGLVPEPKQPPKPEEQVN